MADKRQSPRRFVPNSYGRSDDWAVSKIKGFLVTKGYRILEKDAEDFAIDIAADRHGKIEYFEVETKTGYPFTGKDDYPFDTVSFLARKKKWASAGYWYVILCRETLAFLMCNSNEIYQDKHFIKLGIDSAERKGNDEFYRVPKDKCYWYKLEE